MSARPVVKTSHMNQAMQEFAINAAQVSFQLYQFLFFYIMATIIVGQDAIANFTTEHEIATAIKAKFEQQYPSTYDVQLRDCSIPPLS